jgi:nucleotide-binding universal stress UspA family protein
LVEQERFLILMGLISFKMDRILVAIDFSGDSMNALEHAILWANNLKVHLRLIHVKRYEKLDIPFYYQDVATDQTASVGDFFNYIIQKYGEKYNVPGGVIDFIIREGRIHTEICLQAEQDQVSVIILGTHGVSGFEELWIGSTAFKVVSNATCPVLTIRHGFPGNSPAQIIMPIDVTKETRQKVPLVADIAEAFSAVVHVLGVHETGTKEVITRVNQYVEQVSEYLANREIAFVSDIRNGGNITNLIIDYAKEIDADLITVMTEQTERPENIWLGAYAQQMVNHSPIPVLSIHPSEP